MKKNCILIVEDEQKLARMLEDFLRLQGYETVGAESGQKALQEFYKNMSGIDLILLDIMLPDIDGYEVLREIRRISDVPVIMVTARSSVEDQMNGFEKGADDYITKPYTLQLVKLHIEAVLKRAGKLKSTMEFGYITVDLEGQKVYWKDTYIETTRKEFELLIYFIEHNGIVLARNTILDAVWGYDYVGDIRTVDTLVKQLRKKLTEECTYIRSVYGVGYLFGETENEG
ncbi:MAG: response regulator transcription factor [Eubacteriales bacterium]|nr:response regulator transcription factor [Eubacteriales bacterium]